MPAECHKRTSTVQQFRFLGLLDHRVGEGEQCRRHSEAEFLGGFKVEHKLELGWQHDRQVRRLLVFENPTRIDTGQLK